MKHLLTTGLLHSTITFHLKWAEGKQNTAKFLSWAVDFTRKCTPMAQESGWNGGPDMQGKRTSLMITPAGWHHLIPVSIACQFGRTRRRRLWQASWKPPLMASTGEFAEGSLPIQHKGNSKCLTEGQQTQDCQFPSYFKWETGTETSSATVGKNNFTQPN